RGAAPGVPQHAAAAAHAGDHPLPGHLPGVRLGAGRLLRRGVQSGRPRRPPGRDAALRGRRLLRALLRRFLGRAPAPPEGAGVISVRDVYKSYGEVEVLAACALDVRTWAV